MTDDTSSLVARCTAALENPTPSEVLVLATVAATDGPCRPNEVAATTPLANAYSPCRRLAERDVLTRRKRETERGRDPYVYELAAATRSALDTDAPEWDAEALRQRVVRELATAHYCRTLSAAKSKQLAREIPGATHSQVSTALTQLHDEGVVETVHRGSSTARWRLVGAGLYTPFVALTEDIA